MLTTIAVAGLVCAASALVGEAAARLLGLELRRGYSPAVGLAALMALALFAVKLPGHGTTAAVLLALLIAVSAWLVLRSGTAIRPPLEYAGMGVAVGLAYCIPYISSRRFGLLGVSLNNDITAHLGWATGLGDPGAAAAITPAPGYPVGPHSIVAALGSGLGVGPSEAFAGLMLALPVLIACAALPLLDGLSRPRRAAGATLVALTYSLAAVYTQAGFKEQLMTLFVLALLGSARLAARDSAVPWRLGVQAGLLGGGIVFSFSYGGLAWPVLMGAAWGGFALLSALIGTSDAAAGERARAWLASVRRAVPAVAAACATGAVLLLSDIGRLIDSFSIFGDSPSGTGAIAKSNIGHLVGAIPKREILGFWPREDYRFPLDSTPLSDVLGVFVIVVACAAAVWWLWRRDLAVPAAAFAALVLLVYLGHAESAYTASKGLAPAAALMMVLAVRPLLETWSPSLALRVAQVAVVAVFAGGALWSSFLVLRGAQVGPRAHFHDLEAFRPALEDRTVLFLGNDDFAPPELSGAGVIDGAKTPRDGKHWKYGDPVDFDTAPNTSANLAGFVITTRSAARSELPPNLVHVRTVGAYELWRRRGRIAPRRTLAEGSHPGAILDCRSAKGSRLARSKGWARVWTHPPRTFEVTPQPTVITPGYILNRVIPLPAGRWELSLDYLSPQDLRIDYAGRRTRLPASLDRPGPLFRFGEVRTRRPGPIRIRIKVGSERLGAKSHVASLNKIVAVDLGAAHRLVPLGQACGQYVDWYTLGAKRPQAR